jgi:transposase-like protein
MFVLAGCLDSAFAVIYGGFAALCAGIYSVILGFRCSSCNSLFMKRKYERKASYFQFLRPAWRILVPRKCDGCGQLFTNQIDSKTSRTLEIVLFFLTMILLGAVLFKRPISKFLDDRKEILYWDAIETFKGDQ